MSLSRKRKRELRKLKAHANEVLQDQKVVLDRARDVLIEASGQAKELSDEYVAPRVSEAYASVRPVVDRGVTRARQGVQRLTQSTAPAVTAALVKAIRSLETLEDPRAQPTAQRLRHYGQRAGLSLPKSPKRRGATVAAALVVAAAAVGIGYGLWRTLQSEDELWISPEE